MYPNLLLSFGSSPCTVVWYRRHSWYSSSSNADGTVVTVKSFRTSLGAFGVTDLDLARGESFDAPLTSIASIPNDCFFCPIDPDGSPSVVDAAKLTCPPPAPYFVHHILTPPNVSSSSIAHTKALAVLSASASANPQFRPPAPLPARFPATDAMATATEHECVAPIAVADGALARLTFTGISPVDATAATPGESEPFVAHLATARVTARSIIAATASSSVGPPGRVGAPASWVAFTSPSREIGAPRSSMRPSRYAVNLRSTFFWDLVGVNSLTSRRTVYGGQHVSSSTGWYIQFPDRLHPRSMRCW